MIIRWRTHNRRYIRYDTRCYFNLRPKADVSQLNLRLILILNELRKITLAMSFPTSDFKSTKEIISYALTTTNDERFLSSKLFEHYLQR